MNFQRFSKTVLLLKFPLYTGVLGLFCRFTTMPSVHTKHPGNSEGDAMWSLARRVARLAGIGRLRRRPWPGKRWERTRGLPATGLWLRMGEGASASGRSAARRKHGRGELCSGGLPVWEEARAAQGGCRGACGAVRRLVGGCKAGRQELAMGRPWRTVTTSLRSAPWATFIVGRLLSLRVEVRARRYSAVRRPALACLRAGDARRTVGHSGQASTARYWIGARVARRLARRGTGGPDLEAVGNEPTRTPRQASHPAHGQTDRALGVPVAL
jgi:hypothetical protein